MVCSIIVTTWNEKDTVDEFIQRVDGSFAQSSFDYEIIFVDDASTDGSRESLIDYTKKNQRIKLIIMSRQFGRNDCFFAGFKHAQGDFGATLDSDLQDPPELIPPMLEKLRDQDADVVYSVMVSRQGEHPLKLILTRISYKMLKALFHFEYPEDAGYLKVFNRRVINEINQIQEVDTYFKGFFHWIGLKQIPFPFEREKRFGGKTKFSLLRSRPYLDMLNAIVSFSYAPIYIMLGASIVIFALAVLGGLFSILPPLECLVLGSFSLVSLCVSVIGLYIAQIHASTRRRPQYVIDRKYGI